jgi:hypothetical protein
LFGSRSDARQWLDASAGRILEHAVEILKTNWPEVERLAVRLEREREIHL